MIFQEIERREMEKTGFFLKKKKVNEKDGAVGVDSIYRGMPL